MTVHFHDRGIDHGVLHIRLAADSIKASLSDIGLAPVAKAFENGVPFAEFFRQIAPGAARAHALRHGLYKQTVVRASWPCIAKLAQAVRGHQCPLLVAHALLSMAGLQHKNRILNTP